MARALDHAVSNLRKEAAIALGEIGDPAAIPSPERALDDPDADVRKIALGALREIVAQERV